ncbi:hypothetical protein EG327_003168 [Venturia inaequalis]|uniref:Glutathione S-transferase kappa n=1 Tax=Venturia inaequalis TaxID=5025 RepID=A0A8H3VLD2_VENIN|nr:hypothetical protein EG327_003168 [Venturia inaequalis]
MLKNRELLKQHNVEVEIFPVFLGGIMVGSGNEPPWKNANKAKYSAFDSKRAQRYFGVSFETPPFFPILSLLPQRCMTFMKDNYPAEKYETVFGELWKAMWEEHWDLSKPDKMAECLARHLSNADVKRIMEGANTPECKKKLNDTTQRALDTGAFGCPWFQVTNKEGIAEPFFGSDRFHYMWQHLGVPWQDIAIREKSSL